MRICFKIVMRQITCAGWHCRLIDKTSELNQNFNKWSTSILILTCDDKTNFCISPEMAPSTVTAVVLLVLQCVLVLSSHKYEDHLGHQLHSEHDMNVLLGEKVFKHHSCIFFLSWSRCDSQLLCDAFVGPWGVKETQSRRAEKDDVGNYKEDWQKCWQTPKCR